MVGRLRRTLRGSLAAKLLTSQVLVVAAGSLTLAAVALAAAPGLFRRHARMALGSIPPETARHLDEGLAVAMLTALAIGTGVALLTALAVSWFLARRIVHPIGALARAARQVERGSYAERVPPPGSGDELGVLSRAFNAMTQTAAGVRGPPTAAACRPRPRAAHPAGHDRRLPGGGRRRGHRADDQTWAVLRAETARLRRLVDDLNTVSRAEQRRAGRWDPDG